MFFFDWRQTRRQAESDAKAGLSLPLSNVEPHNISNSYLGGYEEHQLELERRQNSPVTADVSTCGYLNGNASISRTANSGYDCRVDTTNALWGFCPATVINPSDCGLPAACVDAHECKSLCGLDNASGLTTFTCTSSNAPHCSLALLINGPDQTYSYLACANSYAVDTYFDAPTQVSLQSSASSTSALTGATASISLASSTSLTSSTPTPAPAIATSASPQPSTPSSNAGAIAGGVIGGLAVILLLVGAFFFFRRRKSRKGLANDAQDLDAAQPKIEYTNDMSQKTPGEKLKLPGEELSSPVELPSEEPMPELSGGRRGETAELPGQMKGG